MTALDHPDFTQHQRIPVAAANGWVWQVEFWTISKSPHKRRFDMTQGDYKELDGSRGNKGRYSWEERECIHGIKNCKDFLLEDILNRFTGSFGEIEKNGDE